MKKIVPAISIICLMMITSGVTSYSMHKTLTGINPCSDDVDQYQTEYILEKMVPIGQMLADYGPINVSTAQSFIPQTEILTRVFLYVARNTSTTEPLTISIQNHLLGPSLAKTHIKSELVSNETFDWVECDIVDIPVVIGDTYYIVAYTANISDNYYVWAANNDYLSYPHGCAWVSFDNGSTWGNQSVQSSSHCFKKKASAPQTLQNENLTWDLCFMTFGQNDLPVVDISKPSNAVYVANERICNFFSPVVLGVMKIEASASDSSGIKQVDFFIDNTYVGNDTKAPYEWLWTERVFFKHFIKVIATDIHGFQTELEREVWKFF